MLTIDVTMDMRACSTAVVGAALCAMAIITVGVTIALVHGIVRETVPDNMGKKQEIIVIEKSPRPAVTMSSPRSSPILSPKRRRVRRAGRMRVREHRVLEVPQPWS